MESSLPRLGEPTSETRLPECSEDTDAGGVGKYSATAVRKLEDMLSSNGGVNGALVIST